MQIQLYYGTRTGAIGKTMDVQVRHKARHIEKQWSLRIEHGIFNCKKIPYLPSKEYGPAVFKQMEQGPYNGSCHNTNPTPIFINRDDFFVYKHCQVIEFGLYLYLFLV